MHPNDIAQLDQWMSDLQTRLVRERRFTNMYAITRRANIARTIGLILAALIRV